MHKSIIAKVDALIEAYKREHRGEVPLYLIIPPQEGDALVEEIRASKKLGAEAIITSYRDITIAKHGGFVDGKMLLSNELPDTGS